MTADPLFEWKILFLLGFTLHNIEEGLWLPAWSRTVPRFHRAVGSNEFRFAVLVVTVLGVLALAADLLSFGIGSVGNYLFLGFAGMMGINAVLPHLAATVYLRRYAPGVITGVLLNLPFSAVLISLHVSAGAHAGRVALATLFVSITIVSILNPLFALGRFLFDDSAETGLSSE